MNSPNKIIDCAIIGGGPGGLVSALYLKRFKRSVVLVSEGEPRALWIPCIRNLIGYREKTSGRQLIKKLAKQVADYDIPYVNARATIRRIGKYFDVSYADDRVRARTVILATGMKDVQPTEIKNLKELTAAGLIAYCPVCDGFEHCDEPLALIAKNAKGLRKIPVLHNFSQKLVVVYTSSKPIPPYWKAKTKELKIRILQGPIRAARPRTNSLEIYVGRSKIKVRTAYIALGSKVPNGAFKHIKNLRRDQSGFINTNSHQETSIPGLYAVGDCVSALSQVSVAVGHAAIAATHIHNEILKRRN